MASRRVTDLDPRIQSMCKEHVRLCKENGIDLLITCTYRSDAEQTALYAQGRTAPGKIVTNAKAGQSKHNAVDRNGMPASLAYDVVPLREGKPIWGTTGEDGRIWQRVGAVGKKVGMNWAGDWTKFREFPHFEMP